ncbi:HET-domain-containing protein [Setomelanomma holmii]|uniref:HET-domain-containing protein n=1 Tax=Setomelanomma holmii TaxID=210430 RepID=A0A9P4LGC9_9PLEO|nr:HET-domain-containing protein [Setomelanomma holmii]
MNRCALCHDQVKKNEEDPRLAFDFTPEQLNQSAFGRGCDSCIVILEGLRQSETPDWSFHRDIRRVYARCRSKRGDFQDTLRLEVYFIDDRPKLQLEYYSLQEHHVPWSDIPKTFREVMQLALKLGFRYIWIDSLCIVQDDPEDWEVQSSMMSEIYQNAVLTLSATSAAGDDQGCFSNDIHRPTLEITLPQDIGACRIAVRKPLNHMDAQSGTHLQDHFPLLTRGWAFQERLLSPRVLHICESELVWECREASNCECGGLGQEESPGGAYHHAIESSQHEKLEHDAAKQELAIDLGAISLESADNMTLVPDTSQHAAGNVDGPPAYEDIFAPSRTNSSISSETNVGPRTDDDAILAFAAQSNVPVYEDFTAVNEGEVKDCPDLVFHFHRVVEKYSALQLTRPSDRLPALSGLCKRVDHLCNNYLAGLWSDSICYDLLWRVETINLSTESQGARSLDYRGPTWSWISVESPISYWSDIVNFRRRTLASRYPRYYTVAGTQVDKIEMAVTVPGQNPFGTVTSAILTIEASSIKGTLRYTYDPHWLGGAGHHDPVRYKLEIMISRDDAQEPVEVPFQADYSLGAIGPSNVPDNWSLTLLLIHPKVCLVLRPAQRDVAPTVVRGEPTWERIGIARISDALVTYYRIDWMIGSSVKKFHIV